MSTRPCGPRLRNLARKPGWTDLLRHVTRLTVFVFCLSRLSRGPTIGRFITFEGIEGCGKSTHVELLAEALRQRRFRLLLTREPGGTEAGARLRDILLEPGVSLPPMAELLIYLADRVCHLQQVIIPALDTGQIVLCDRFADSTVAYQGFGRQLDLNLVKRWDEQSRAGLKPDLTILLDCPVEVGLRRINRRPQRDRFEREEHGFHKRVRDGFLQLAAAEPERIKLVDATLPIDSVHRTILSIVSERLQAA